LAASQALGLGSSATNLDVVEVQHDGLDTAHPRTTLILNELHPDDYDSQGPATMSLANKRGI
jgi:hypothetical protein